MGTDDRREYDVLVVDDDPDSRRVAFQFLTEAGLHVRESNDGESALVEMHRRSPDVVVLDLMMPVLDGFGVLATMRADPVLSSVPVVVLTAKSLSEAERQFLSRSAVRVLQKGEYRLADVAALVLRAASGARIAPEHTQVTGSVPMEST
jgi:CheY-like chemotaxis protein